LVLGVALGWRVDESTVVHIKRTGLVAVTVKGV
jgi:hypothetical protein